MSSLSHEKLLDAVFVYDDRLERAAVAEDVLATVFGEDSSWMGQGGLALVERRGPDGSGDALLLASDDRGGVVVRFSPASLAAPEMVLLAKEEDDGERVVLYVGGDEWHAQQRYFCDEALVRPVLNQFLDEGNPLSVGRWMTLE